MCISNERIGKRTTQASLIMEACDCPSCNRTPKWRTHKCAVCQTQQVRGRLYVFRSQPANDFSIAPHACESSRPDLSSVNDCPMRTSTQCQESLSNAPSSNTNDETSATAATEARALSVAS